jgi:5-methylcytosine-specific restriction protein A
MGRLASMPKRLGGLAPRVQAAPKQVESFYASAAWRELVARRRRDPDYAEAKARAKPGERLILDHDRERKDGGADLDPGNTKWLTMSEHAAKTARARARRARGEA